MGLISRIRGRLQHSGTKADKPSARSEPFWDNWPRETLGQQLTNLLVDNGSSVNKQSILALKGFLAQRDKELIEHAVKQHTIGIQRLEYVHTQLQADTGVSDLQPSDSNTTTKVNDKAQS